MDRNQLVKAMCKAFYCPMFQEETAYSKQNLGAMSAALDVAVEESLSTPTEKELRDSVVSGASHDACVEKAFASRRARLSNQKTPEERVTVDIKKIDGGWHVSLDGRWQESFNSEYKAEIYCLGLITKLKQEQK
jgi:hypothetical protein